jgi:hypothetical protein
VLAKLRSSLTYANVMATVAVFVALGGTSYAVATGSIDSREIKNNSVKSADLRNNNVSGKDVRQGTLRSGDVADGSLLEKDFKAGELPAGARGETGAQGPPGISGLQKVVGSSGTANSNSGKFATATCPAGKRAIGSGGQVGGLTGVFPDELAHVVITFLEPSDENTVPGSVTAFAFEQEVTSANWFLQATAICANVS